MTDHSVNSVFIKTQMYTLSTLQELGCKPYVLGWISHTDLSFYLWDTKQKTCISQSTCLFPSTVSSSYSNSKIKYYCWHILAS